MYVPIISDIYESRKSVLQPGTPTVPCLKVLHVFVLHLDLHETCLFFIALVFKMWIIIKFWRPLTICSRREAKFRANAYREASKTSCDAPVRLSFASGWSRYCCYSAGSRCACRVRVASASQATSGATSPAQIAKTGKTSRIVSDSICCSSQVNVFIAGSLWHGLNSALCLVWCTRFEGSSDIFQAGYESEGDNAEEEEDLQKTGWMGNNPPFSEAVCCPCITTHGAGLKNQSILVPLFSFIGPT